jgi:hypothetical protein
MASPELTVREAVREVPARATALRTQGASRPRAPPGRVPSRLSPTRKRGSSATTCAAGAPHRVADDARVPDIQVVDQRGPPAREGRASQVVADSEVVPHRYVSGIRHDGGYDLESLRSAILADVDVRAKADSRHA